MVGTSSNLGRASPMRPTLTVEEQSGHHRLEPSFVAAAAAAANESSVVAPQPQTGSQSPVSSQAPGDLLVVPAHPDTVLRDFLPTSLSGQNQFPAVGMDSRPVQMADMRRGFAA